MLTNILNKINHLGQSSFHICTNQISANIGHSVPHMHQSNYCKYWSQTVHQSEGRRRLGGSWSDFFDDDGDSLTPTDTGAAHRILEIAASDFVYEIGSNAGAGGPQWMAQSDGAPVDVGSGIVQA